MRSEMEMETMVWVSKSAWAESSWMAVRLWLGTAWAARVHVGFVMAEERNRFLRGGRDKSNVEGMEAKQS